MAFLNTDQVTQIVADSLKVIADLPAGNISSATLSMLNDDQKQIFASTLKTNINAAPFRQRDSSSSDEAFYDISLTMDIVNSWNTVGDCINWIVANQAVVSKN